MASIRFVSKGAEVFEYTNAEGGLLAPGAPVASHRPVEEEAGSTAARKPLTGSTLSLYDQLQAARAVKEEAYKAAHSNLNAVPKALDEEEVAFLDEHAAEERRRDEEEAARESRDKQLYQLQLAERAAAKLASQAAAATAGLLVPTLGKRSGSGPAALASSTLPTAGVRVLPRVAVVPIALASAITAGSSAAAPASNTGTAATGTTLDTSMSASSAPVERNDTLSAGNEESANAPASAAKRRRIDGADGQHEQGVRPSAAHVGNDLAPPASVPVSAKSVGGGSPATSSGAAPSKAVLASLLDYSDDEASSGDA